MISNSQPKTPRQLFHGPFQPVLEEALAGAIAAHRVAHGPLAPLTVIVPTRLLGLHLQRALARALAGHLNVRFQTLDDFAPPRPAPLLLEFLCRQLAQQTGTYFAPVKDTPGFASALLATFTDLQEANLTRLPGKTQKLRELAAAYAKFNAVISPSIFHPPSSSVLLYGFYDLNAAQRALVQQLVPASIFFPTGNEFTKPLLDWFLAHGYAGTDSPPFTLHSPPSTILSCPGEPAEVREAIRAALDWLAADPRRTCNDIAILCRSREQYDALLRDMLPQHGLRAFFRGGRPLLEHPDAQLLLLFLEVIRTDYSRAAVIELACHTGPHTGWDAFTVRLGIVAGQSQWRARLHAAGNSAPELARFVESLFLTGNAVPANGRWAELAGAVVTGWRALGGNDPDVADAIRSLTDLDSVASPVEFATFADFAQRALAGRAYQTESFQGGGIFVSDVMGARGLSFPFVILLGMVEKSFPRIIREDPLLLDAERGAISSDLPLKLRAHGEERLLFELARGVAREQLLLTYPRLDPLTGKPRVGSSFLLGLEADARTVPLGTVAGQLDERELDLAALNTLADPAPYLTAVSPLLAAGVAAEMTRWREAKLTAHDGVFESAAALRLLRERFGLDRLVSSATALERFFRCPFAYFQQQVLRLEEWEEPEAALAIDAADLGSLYHAILEDFYRAGGTGDIAALADRYLAVFEQHGVTGFPAVWAIKKEIIRQELTGFVERERRRLGTEWRPAEFEKEFHEVAVAPPVRLRGKIDRIDLSTDGGRARVYDYKTGKRPDGFKNDSLAAGEALQLPLYLLAAEQLLPGIRIESASYLYFTLRGGFSDIRFTRAALDEQRAALTHLLGTAAAMIRDGSFAQYAAKEKCARCPYRPACGNGIVKLAERKAADKRLQDFLAIKEPVKDE